MGASQALDASGIVTWATLCVRNLETLQTAIDGINVYPVADGDTGSNLLHTMRGAVRDAAAESEVTSAGAVLDALAKGAVTAARGNSGVILSQVFRGFADATAGHSQLDGHGLAAALRQADQAATQAVARPVAGTMLSVLHAAAAAATELAHAAQSIESGSPMSLLTRVVENASEAAATALADTPRQLPVLAAAGVVDAGGRGLVAVLDALAETVGGKPTARVDHSHSASEAMGSVVGTAPQTSGHPYAWEVMYLLSQVPEKAPEKAPEVASDPLDNALASLRQTLSGLGDSVTVAGDSGSGYAVHVHCADIGAAIEAGIAVGRLSNIRVEPLFTPPPTHQHKDDHTVVAVVDGDQFAQLLRAEGIAVLAISDGGLPTLEQTLGLLTETTTRHVTVLSASPRLTGAVDAAIGHAMIGDREVVVIPCASPVQILAALAVHDSSRRVRDDVVAMAEASAATRRGELLVASEESLTWAGRAQRGDVLGLVDDEVMFIGSAPADVDTVAEVAAQVVARMLAAGGELVTMLLGAHAPAGLADELHERLHAAHPEFETTSYVGGQRDAVLLIGVE